MEEQRTTRPPWGSWLKTIAGFVAPTTVLTGLLLYFGFAYTDALYEYFGVDAATLGFSTRDYLLRSAGALYMPVGITLGIGLLGALGYLCVTALISSRPGLVPLLTWVSVALIVVGFILFTLGMLGGLAVWRAGALDTPLLLGGGLMLVLYGRVLHLKCAGRPYPFAREMTALVLIAALVALSSFWAVSAYAQEHGRSDARYLARNLRLRPEVVVDTAERLYFGHTNVQETQLPDGGPGQHFKFRYHGLRLLAQSNSRMFIIPEGWNARRGSVMILPADASVRVAFRPG
ncbi:hypothetical protein AB0C81_04350 [Streptomyces roseoverticillatus]|uniref:hypothetical protein n=1 Tax=Streptomyces roseoverticillatus TaxID=66429 RepID=UPI003408399B